MGEENESIVVEEFCVFKVNGITGWGTAEWQRRNPKSITVK